METESPHPDPRQAREALDEADRAAEAARRPALPTWFFPVMAVLVVALLAAQMLDGGVRRTAMFGVLVVALLLNVQAQRQTGIAWRSDRLRGQLPFLIVILALIAATAVAVAISGLTWLWAVGALAAGAVVLVTGALYRPSGRR